MLLYHVTTDLDFKSNFTPRIPSAYACDEDQTIPRICFSTSLGGCFSALPSGNSKLRETNRKTGGLYRVYTYRVDGRKKTNSMIGSKDLWVKGLVHDALETGEYWVLKPIVFKESDSFLIKLTNWDEEDYLVIPYKVFEQLKARGLTPAYLYETNKAQDFVETVKISNLRYRKVESTKQELPKKVINTYTVYYTHSFVVDTRGKVEIEATSAKEAERIFRQNRSMSRIIINNIEKTK